MPAQQAAPPPNSAACPPEHATMGHCAPPAATEVPVAAAPPEALSGPAHAQDLFFDPADAARSRAGSRAVVVHYNGSFHTDMGLGTAERALRRMPSARAIVVSAVPVGDPWNADPAPFADRGDYIILTPRPPARTP